MSKRMTKPSTIGSPSALVPKSWSRIKSRNKAPNLAPSPDRLRKSKS